MTLSSTSNHANVGVGAVPGWRSHRLPGLMQTIGPLLTRQDEQGWCYALLLTQAHMNQAGVMHGGVCTALLDQALSTVAWERAGRIACVTVQLDTQFLQPAQCGQLLVARAAIVHEAGSLFFMTGTVDVETGPVATGQAILKRLSKSSGA